MPTCCVAVSVTNTCTPAGQPESNAHTLAMTRLQMSKRTVRNLYIDISYISLAGPKSGARSSMPSTPRFGPLAMASQDPNDRNFLNDDESDKQLCRSEPTH